MANRYEITTATKFVVVESAPLSHREVLFFDSMNDLIVFFSERDEPNNGYYRVFELGEEHGF